jgi:hypothetical protein
VKNVIRLVGTIVLLPLALLALAVGFARFGAAAIAALAGTVHPRFSATGR